MNGIVRVLVLAAALILAACETTPVEEDASFSSLNESLSSASKAPKNGPIIYRGSFDHFIYFFTNWDEQLFSVHSTKDHFFCPGGWEQEGGDVSPLERQGVVTPAEMVIRLRDADLYTILIQPANPTFGEAETEEEWWSGFCDLVDNGTRVAEGMVRLKETNTDTWAVGPGVDSWTMQLRGDLNDLRPGGGTIHFSVMWKFLFDDENPDWDKVLVFELPTLL